jgi:hypothetical protein
MMRSEFAELPPTLSRALLAEGHHRVEKKESFLAQQERLRREREEERRDREERERQRAYIREQQRLNGQRAQQTRTLRDQRALRALDPYLPNWTLFGDETSAT